MTTPLLEVENLSVRYADRGAWRRRSGGTLAVDGVSFSVGRGEVLGVVGESGSGKSTLGRAILGLAPVSCGRVAWNGRDLSAMGRTERRELRRLAQIVFQDPFGAFDPRLSIRRSMALACAANDRSLSAAAIAERIATALDRVRLAPELAARRPGELSGGQCQRAAIARVIALRPKLIVCDEVVSALDVSVQAQVINLLLELREAFGLSYLFITHNVAVLKHIADRTIVMQTGRVVEDGGTEALLASPRTAYTQSLLAAVLAPDPAIARSRLAALAPATAGATR